jgi:hypothetical protein
MLVIYSFGIAVVTLYNARISLDYEYKKRNDVYYVVHVDCCPNGIDVKPFPCWTVYPLY